MAQKKFSIICFAWDQWGPMWKNTQQLMWYLSKKEEIHKILYINKDLDVARFIESFNKNFTLSDLKNTYLKSIFGKLDTYNNKIMVLTPFHYMPFYHRFPNIRNLNNKIFKYKINRILKKYKFKNIILFINRDISRAILDLFPDNLISCFYWSDNWSSFPDSAQEVNELDLKKMEKIDQVIEAILRRSDIVFCVSEYLTDRAKKIVPNSYWMPNGTDYENFSKVSLHETPIADEVRSIPHPIIGFMGFISGTIDYELLEFAIRSRPDWSFVFIGPKLPAASWGNDVFKFSNVFYLGPKPFFDLPKYMKAFDVCIIPYINHPRLQFADSNKVYDYLATGKPVVASTKTAGLGKHENIIRISGNKEKFVIDIEAALNEKDNRLVLERKETAKKNSWEKRADFMWENINQLLK